MAKIIKRTFDLVVAALAILLLCPLMMIIWLGVRLGMGKPALFRQLRAGKNGHPFTICKFRTMIETPVGYACSDEERLTTLGRFLRNSSLDEVPELWNVLRGEMSLVGPRPLLMQYLDRYDVEQRKRLNALPGITGWAQVHGRNSISWEARFAMDVWYVDHQSLWLDTKILLLTVLRIVQGRDIRYPGHATMPEFMGTDITRE